MEFLNPQCAARSFGPANGLLSSFVTSLFALHCSLSKPDLWPRDYGKTALSKSLGEYDFVIVGAGTAGSVVAGRLAENIHHKILLIEAGGDPPIEYEIPSLAPKHRHTEYDWMYATRGSRLSCLAMQDEMCIWHKGRVLGGSDSIDDMFYLRGTSRDYDYWDEQGNVSWGWDDVLNYFRKSENFTGENRYGAHGTLGLLKVEAFQSPKLDQFMILKAAEEMGYKKVEDFVNGHYLGFGKVYGTLKDGRRSGVAKAFLSDTKPNLHVIKHAVAKQILFRQDMNVDKVRFVYDGKHEMEVRARKEVIISAGTIETPKLLMLSGFGPKKHLKALNITILGNLPIGNNLRDHVKVDVLLRMNYQDSLGLQSDFMNAFFNQWVNGKGPLGAASLDVCGFIDTDGNGFYPDVQVTFNPIHDMMDYGRTLKPEIFDNITSRINNTDRIIAVSVSLLKPKSRGFVRLNSTDYLDPPLIYPNYLRREPDMKILMAGLRRLLEFEQSATFRSLDAKFIRIGLAECDAYEYLTDDYLSCYIKYMTNSMYHAIGTARMGAIDDKRAVVSPELKLRGTEGLRIIDASVMPSMVSAGTNPAVIMIAEKGADLIKADWGY